MDITVYAVTLEVDRRNVTITRTKMMTRATGGNRIVNVSHSRAEDSIHTREYILI